MPIRVELLGPGTEGAYRDLCAEDPTSLLFHSLEYRDFLSDVLPSARPRYLLAFDGDVLRAALPAFVVDGPHGTVVNSLPFYGSNGGLLAGGEVERDVLGSLLNGFESMCLDEGAVLSTIVTNPLRADQDWLRDHHSPDFMDSRIGQLTPLPEASGEVDLPEHLMGLFHQKTRNMVRKGLRAGFEIADDGSEGAMRELHRIHADNMASIGGLAKPWSVFEAIRSNFTHGRDYHVYMARRGGMTHAALLVLRSNRTSEYFTPVVVESSRSEQPLSHLIFTAMQDAVHAGSNWWNWGGTWHTQDGVHRFKSRWGTTDIPYHYLVRSHRDISGVLACTPEELLSAYPGFFVLPFSVLETAS